VSKKAVVAALLVAGSGCASIPLHPVGLYSDPTRGSPPLVEHLWDVDWWLKLVPDQFWEYEPQEVASPAVDPETGRLYVLTRDGLAHCIAPDGKAEWTFKAGGRFDAGAEVAGGVIYFGNNEGTLFALKARTGERLWTYDSKEELATAPVIDGQRVLVASQTSTLFAVDRGTGKWAWQYRRDMPGGFTVHGASRPAVALGTVFIGFADGEMVALDANDGTLKWERALAAAGPSTSSPVQFLDVDTSPAVDAATGRVFVASYAGGLYALDAKSGEIVWQSATQGITNLASAGEVLFASGDRQVTAYAAATGTPIWTYNPGDRAARRPVLARELLVVPLSSSLVFLDARTGRQRRAWDPGEGVSAAPLWTGSHLVVLSNLGYLYSMYLPGRAG